MAGDVEFRVQSVQQNALFGADLCVVAVGASVEAARDAMHGPRRERDRLLADAREAALAGPEVAAYRRESARLAENVAEVAARRRRVESSWAEVVRLLRAGQDATAAEGDLDDAVTLVRRLENRTAVLRDVVAAARAAAEDAVRSAVTAADQRFRAEAAEAMGRASARLGEAVGPAVFGWLVARGRSAAASSGVPASLTAVPAAPGDAPAPAAETDDPASRRAAARPPPRVVVSTLQCWDGTGRQLIRDGRRLPGPAREPAPAAPVYAAIRGLVERGVRFVRDHF